MRNCVLISYPMLPQPMAFCILFAVLLYIPAGQSQSLPKEMRADQYLLEAQEAYREGKHRQAVEAFQRIESLGVSIPSEFHFFYGSSLAETGRHADALRQLSEYLNQSGREGRHYQTALRLYGRIEPKAAKEEIRQKIFHLTYDRSNSDAGFAIAPSPGGGYVAAGVTDPKGAGDSDIWIVKIDDEGRKQWGRTYGGSNQDAGYAIASAPDGGYVVAGITQSKGAGNLDMWVLKIDDEGFKQWDRTYGGSDQDAGYAIAPAPDGGYIVAGYTHSKVAGDGYMWIVKIDDQGRKQWDRAHNKNKGSFEAGHAIAPAPGGGYIVTGSTLPQGAGDSDMWIVKIDDQGRKQWDRTYGGSNSNSELSIAIKEHANAIVPAPGGGYIVAGSTDSKGAGNLVNNTLV
jgi:tetratricopeptide (TPR) repeat protein